MSQKCLILINFDFLCMLDALEDQWHHITPIPAPNNPLYPLKMRSVHSRVRLGNAESQLSISCNFFKSVGSF